ncbi:MAG: CDP-diacylglycerol--glycerol-3-phosphate 3-phosphatidyltransferase [Limisphaerales bacterium]
MTTANKITIVRILLVPFFVMQLLYYLSSGQEWHRVLAIFSFAVAALSDGVDGYIARRYNQRSELGAILDPLADKLLLLSGIILLSRNVHPYFERIPLYLAAIIISRDALVLMGLGLIHYTFGKIKVQPRLTGKIATVLQMAAVLWTLFQWKKTFLPWLTAGAAIFTGISGILYLWDGTRQLNASPTSAPEK